MDIFDALTLAGGLSLFLFGMSVMGRSLLAPAVLGEPASLMGIALERCRAVAAGNHSLSIP